VVKFKVLAFGLTITHDGSAGSGIQKLEHVQWILGYRKKPTLENAGNLQYEQAVSGSSLIEDVRY
jgi:hypothetical protein